MFYETVIESTNLCNIGNKDYFHEFIKTSFRLQKKQDFFSFITETQNARIENG